MRKLKPAHKTEDAAHQAHIEKVKAFFVEPLAPDANRFELKARNKEPKRHFTIPALAQYLGIYPEEITQCPQDHEYYPVYQFALLNCQNYLINGMLDGRIDKPIGTMLLEQYHGFVKGKKQTNGQLSRKISDILDEYEAED